jgi:phospholipid/cholesterol/gamma-HCH transport system permease protein
MQVTEQIDAMRALGTDPSKKLVTPRVVSTVIMLVVLTVIADLASMFGGSLVAVFMLRLDGNQYWSTAWQSLAFDDILMGLIKPFIFGFIISTVGCYYGMTARGGTQGVGRATTQAMVSASVTLVISDLFITKLLLNFFPNL